MKEHDLKPPTDALPEHVAALLAAERPLPPVDGGVHDRLLARIEASLGPSVAAPTVAAPTVAAPTGGIAAGGLMKLVVALLAVGGVVIWAAWPGAPTVPGDSGENGQPVDKSDTLSKNGEPANTAARSAAKAPENLTMDPVLPNPTKTDTVSDSPLAAVTPTAPPETSLATTPPAAAATPANVAPRPSAPSAPEHTLIAEARQALKAADLDRARKALAAHRRAWPRGLLAEERDALGIRLAIAQGNIAEAERLRARFHTNYPESVHGRGLDALLR